MDHDLKKLCLPQKILAGLFLKSAPQSKIHAHLPRVQNGYLLDDVYFTETNRLWEIRLESVSDI